MNSIRYKGPEMTGKAFDKENTVKWLKDAIAFHDRESISHTTETRWIAEQHQERASAIRAALLVLESSPQGGVR
jgi:hypothetical protein